MAKSHSEHFNNFFLPRFFCTCCLNYCRQIDSPCEAFCFRGQCELCLYVHYLRTSVYKSRCFHASLRHVHNFARKMWVNASAVWVIDLRQKQPRFKKKRAKAKGWILSRCCRPVSYLWEAISTIRYVRRKRVAHATLSLGFVVCLFLCCFPKRKKKAKLSFCIRPRPNGKEAFCVSVLTQQTSHANASNSLCGT